MSSFTKSESTSFPDGYQPPEVWAHERDLGGKFGAMNKSTAGARSEAALPVGDHKLQLYSLGTPNGMKVTILFEELQDVMESFDYDAWFVDIFKLEQFGSEFVAANPNSKIPALTDSDHFFSPPLRVFESGNILKHVAEIHGGGRFIPDNRRERAGMLKWLCWQISLAPYIG